VGEKSFAGVRLRALGGGRLAYEAADGMGSCARARGRGFFERVPPGFKNAVKSGVAIYCSMAAILFRCALLAVVAEGTCESANARELCPV
jgi:hypothetical protein